MLTIKFSKDYPKLHKQERARLLYIENVHFDKLSKDLIEYDTRGADGIMYDLPRTELLQLVFLGDKGIPFCTLRRQTKQKEEYYKKNVGQEFKIAIEKS